MAAWGRSPGHPQGFSLQCGEQMPPDGGWRALLLLKRRHLTRRTLRPHLPRGRFRKLPRCRVDVCVNAQCLCIRVCGVSGPSARESNISKELRTPLSLSQKPVGVGGKRGKWKIERPERTRIRRQFGPSIRQQVYGSSCDNDKITIRRDASDLPFESAQEIAVTQAPRA